MPIVVDHRANVRYGPHEPHLRAAMNAGNALRRNMIRRYIHLTKGELINGYYLGFNPHPDDGTHPINQWEDFE